MVQWPDKLMSEVFMEFGMNLGHQLRVHIHCFVHEGQALSSLNGAGLLDTGSLAFIKLKLAHQLFFQIEVT